MINWFSESGLMESSNTSLRPREGSSSISTVKMQDGQSFEVGEVRLEGTFTSSSPGRTLYMYSATTTPGEPGVTLQLRDPEDPEDKNELSSVLARIQQEESGALSISYHEGDIDSSIDVLLGSNTLPSTGQANSNGFTGLFSGEGGGDLELSPLAGTSDSYPNDNSASPPLSNTENDNESNEEEKGGSDASKLSVKKPRSKASSPNRQGPQQCQICGKIFGNASALAKHKLTHSDERKYVCTMCGKAFKRQDHLNGHMLTHRNKKPYECRAEGCGKSYCDARSLRRHTENHHSGMHIPSSAASSPSTPVVKEEESTQSCIQYAPPPTSGSSTTTSGSDPVPSTSKTHHVSHLQQLLASEPANTVSASTSTSGGMSSNEGLTKQQLDLIHQIMQQTQQAASQTKPPNQQHTSATASKQKNWTVQTSSSLTKTPPSTSKPVECNLCHRKFKNIPALNGHMRLHGGYFKKDSDSKKCEKKEVTGPPLQTASVSVRALIEEKIIQKRTNPGQSSQSLATQHAGNQVSTPISLVTTEKPAPKSIQISANFLPQTGRPTEVPPAPTLTPSQPCVDHPLLKKSPTKINVKRASSDPGLLQPSLPESATTQLQLALPPDTYAFMDDGYLSPPLPDDVLEQVEQVQESMLLQGVDPAQLAESIQAATLQDIASLEDYESPAPSPQSFQHHQDIQSVLDSPLPVGLADFAYAHSQQANSDGTVQPYPTSPLPSPSFTYPTPPASQEGHSPSFPPLQSVISNGNVASPLSAAFYTSPMSSSAAVEAALNEVLPPHNYPSSPPNSPLSNSPVPSPLSLPPTSTSPLPLHGLQSQMMPNSDDPLLSSSPRDFCSRKRFDFQAFKLLASGALDFGNASSQGVTGIVLDRNGELKLVQTSCFQTMKTNPVNSSPLYVNTKPKHESTYPNDCGASSVKAVALPTRSFLPLKHKANVGSLESVKEDLEDVFLSPSVPASPVRVKKRPRLENPMFNNSYVSRLRKPREKPRNDEKNYLYTPPPILPPTRHGRGLYWQTVTTWPCSTTIKGVQHIDEASLDMVTDTEPAVECDSSAHINVGEDFQVTCIPSCEPNSYQERKENVHERLLWDANLIKHAADESKVNMFLDFACCAAIPGGGRNKEYALHVLQLCDGKFRDAMLRLMQPTPTLQADHPLLSFDYPDSERWTPSEIEAFQSAIMKFEKDFTSIAQEVGSKTGKQCVQFYYIWKKLCPEYYKRLRSVCELETVSTSSETRSFACEQQDCSASFNSRAALTAHTRLHLSRITRSATPDKRSSTSQSNASETSEEFPCKICGKIFNKVKSRSAHMKSHRPPDADTRKLKVDSLKSETGDPSTSRGSPAVNSSHRSNL